MAAYIRSKITNSDFTDVTIEAEDSNAKVRQDGTFKLPIASGANLDTPVGSIRYNDVIEKIEFKTTAGWKVIDAITDGLATEEYVNNTVINAIGNLAPVAVFGNFSDLYNIPTTLAGYGITDDIASTVYVDTSIANLIGGAPGFLDTLNEISNALNNDPDFYNNIITQLSNKLDLAGGTLTGPLYLNSNPVGAMEAATKEYVDNATAGLVIYSTDDLPEGATNLYYTDIRAEAAAKNALSAGTGVYYDNNTGVISIGQSVGTTDNVTFNTVVADTVIANRFEITATGNYTVSSATNIVLNAGMEVIVNSPLTLPSFQTANLNSLVVQLGTIVYDNTVDKLKIYTTTGWSEITGSGFSGDYNDLTNKPTLFSGAYADLTGKPTLFSGDYNDLTNKPTLFSGAYADLTGKPTLATVATTGSYTDLINKPAIPSDVSDLSDTLNLLGGGSGASQWSDIRFDGGTDFDSLEWDDFENNEFILKAEDLDATAGLSGTIDYSQITNTPTIPTLLSQLTNDVGYITSGGGGTDSQTLSLIGNLLSISNGNSVTIDQFSGDYNDLINTPSIPTALSQLTNDSGYITGVTWNDITSKPTFAAVATSGSYSDLSGTPTVYSNTYIGTTNVLFNRSSASQTLTGVSIDGNAGTVTNGVYTTGSYANPAWITSLAYSKLTGAPTLATVATTGSYNDLINKPTNVSTFTNDAGYLTAIPDETFESKAGATGVVTHDCSANKVFIHSTPTANFTANLTNLNLASGKATVITLLINQGATAYVPNALQIGGVSQTISWQGSTTAPSGNANKKDAIGFTIYNVGGTYTVLGQLVSFG